MKSKLNLSPLEKTLLGVAGGGCVLVWIVLGVLFLNTSDHTTVVSANMTGSANSVQTPSSGGHAVRPSPTTWPKLTPLYFPTSTPTVTPAPSPTPNAIGVRQLDLPADLQVIALLGIDERRDTGLWWRTDSIILALVQPERKHVSLLSVPRDLWVYIPGHGYNRINTVDALGVRSGHTGGGRGLLSDTLRYNLGIPVHRYVRIDFQGFVNIVDALGGVDVYVEKAIVDSFPDPLSAEGVTELVLSPGLQHLDGHTALGFCRSRKTTSDFDRSHRQQLVLKALWKKALTPETIARAPRLWEAFQGTFETDIGLNDALALAKTFQDLDPESVRSVNLGFDTAHPWTTPQGAQVLLPDTPAIQQIILELVEK